VCHILFAGFCAGAHGQGFCLNITAMNDDPIVEDGSAPFADIGAVVAMRFEEVGQLVKQLAFD